MKNLIAILTVSIILFASCSKDRKLVQTYYFSHTEFVGGIQSINIEDNEDLSDCESLTIKQGMFDDQLQEIQIFENNRAVIKVHHDIHDEVETREATYTKSNEMYTVFDQGETCPGETIYLDITEEPNRLKMKAHLSRIVYNDSTTAWYKQNSLQASYGFINDYNYRYVEGEGCGQDVYLVYTTDKP